MNADWASRWAAAYSNKVEAELRELYADDVDFEDVAMGHKENSFNDLWTFMRSALVDGAEHRWEIRRYVGDENGGALEWTWYGKHAVDLPGMPAKGKTTQIEGVSVLRFRDGKIAAERDFWNVADLLQQIGA